MAPYPNHARDRSDLGFGDYLFRRVVLCVFKIDCDAILG